MTRNAGEPQNVNDAGLTLLGAGCLTGTGSPMPAAPDMSGSGYLTLVNLDGTAQVAVGATGVTPAGASTTGFTLLPNQGRRIPVADVTKWFVNAPTSKLVSWDFMQ